MTINQLLDALVGSKESFEAALPQVPEMAASELIKDLVSRLDVDIVLDNAERERRLNTVYSRVPLNPDGMRMVAEIGASISNAILRNALTQLLPPEYKSIVFKGSAGSTVGGMVQAAVVSDSFASHDEASVQLRPAPLLSPFFSDVIVLSITDDPATKKLLESARFVPLRCASMEALEEMIATNEGICAFLVETSFISSMTKDQQTALVNKVAAYSTFAWLRFQEDALLPSNEEVGHLIARARCRTTQPEVIDVSFRDKGGIQQRELASLSSARARLMEGEAHGLFIPGELASLELKLLGAAMSQYSKKRRFNPRAELTQVTTKFLQGGQTGARVALVKVNDLRVPVIVKLDRKELILDEARRFLTFVHKDNPELNPEVHLHADAALIVFGIIPDANTEAEQPAPTLEQCLTDYWYGEMKDPSHCDDGRVLLKGFVDAARRLAILNKQRCLEAGFPCKANPFIEIIKSMESEGFAWGFDANAINQRGNAEKLLAPVVRQAICHGDAHTRNVLIRGEQGFLIDYAYSGPDILVLTW